MSLPADVPVTMIPEHHRALKEAVACLEFPNFAARLAAYAGRPIEAAIRFMPKAVDRQINGAVQTAILKCLELAVTSLNNSGGVATGKFAAKLISGVSGGIGGFFGISALPVELPFTTIVMLRSIADIAQGEGEDLNDIETQLACLEVFALGAREPNDRVDVDYYTVRVVLTKLSNDMASLVLERGAVNASSPVVAKLVGEIATRFSLVVTDMATASLLPVVGAMGGATVNVIFMDHFQRIAHAHFLIRRLERHYGNETIRSLYHDIRQQLRSSAAG